MSTKVAGVRDGVLSVFVKDQFDEEMTGSEGASSYVHVVWACLGS